MPVFGVVVDPRKLAGSSMDAKQVVDFRQRFEGTGCVVTVVFIFGQNQFYRRPHVKLMPANEPGVGVWPCASNDWHK